MLQKFLKLSWKRHQKPSGTQAVPEKPDSSGSSSPLKIVHVGGIVESYYMAIPASIILDKYPAYVLAKPEVFRRPWDSVVHPEKVLRLGQKFLLIPRRTIRKLQRRIVKPSSKDLSVAFVSQASGPAITSHVAKSDENESSISTSFHQQSDVSISIWSFSSAFKKKAGINKHVRFQEIEGNNKSSGSSNSQLKKDESAQKEPNPRSSQGRKRSASRQIVVWQPSLKAITESQGN